MRTKQQTDRERKRESPPKIKVVLMQQLICEAIHLPSVLRLTHTHTHTHTHTDMLAVMVERERERYWVLFWFCILTS